MLMVFIFYTYLSMNLVQSTWLLVILLFLTMNDKGLMITYDGGE